MVHLSILPYDIFTRLPPVLVMLVELESVYHMDFPEFVLRCTGNEQVHDRGYNKKKRRKDGGYGLIRTLPPLFYKHSWFDTLSWL